MPGSDFKICLNCSLRLVPATMDVAKFLCILLVSVCSLKFALCDEQYAHNPFFTKDKLHILYPFDVNSDGSQLDPVTEHPQCTAFLKANNKQENTNPFLPDYEPVVNFEEEMPPFCIAFLKLNIKHQLTPGESVLLTRIARGVLQEGADYFNGQFLLQKPPKDAPSTFQNKNPDHQNLQNKRPKRNVTIVEPLIDARFRAEKEIVHIHFKESEYQPTPTIQKRDTQRAQFAYINAEEAIDPESTTLNLIKRRRQFKVKAATEESNPSTSAPIRSVIRRPRPSNVITRKSSTSEERNNPNWQTVNYGKHDRSNESKSKPVVEDEVVKEATKADVNVNGRVSGYHQRRAMTRSGNEVRGQYSYADRGFLKVVHYEAGVNGFRIVQEEVLPLEDFNERVNEQTVQSQLHYL